MIAPRWRKALRDLIARPGRSLLAVLAMAAGVFEIVTLLHSHALLEPELEAMYGRTQPASATLVLDRVSDELVDSVRALPGVASAEARPVIVARIRVGADEYVPAVLFVVRDFDRQAIDTFAPEAGAWPPADRDLLLERTALSVAKSALGDSLTVRTAGGEDRRVGLAGTVHAAGIAPAWMEHMVTGFVGWGSVLREGSDESAQIRIVVADHPLDEGYVREVADSVKSMLERRGQVVSRIDVPTLGKHPHAAQMEAFRFLVLGFGLLSLAMGLVLVVAMTHALMVEQTRQIGMMKAIGATDFQIAGIYLAQVGLLSLGALLIGIPLGIAAGGAYAQFSAGILNTDVSRSPFPGALLAMEIVAGLLIPLVVGLLPIARASRVTVREALNDDPPAPSVGPMGVAAVMGFRWLPRPLALFLRPTFARRGRLALTLGMLAIGGGAFMAALNVSAAWTRAVDADFRVRRYDLSIGLSEPRPIAELARVLAREPGVERAEYWTAASPYLIGESGVPGERVTLLGMEPDSRLLGFPLLSGRWLRPGDRGAVINRGVLARHPSLRVGDSVRVRLRGRTVSFPVVGVAKELPPMATIYAPRAAVLEATGGDPTMSKSIQVVARRHDDAAQREVARALERAFEREGIEVTALRRLEDSRQGILDHLVIILTILTMAAAVVVVVGGLGLTSMLTLGVVQRTREIGILGAIGASPATLARHVWIEGVLIGVLSWVLANLVTIPITAALGAGSGQIFFRAPLDFYMSPAASGIWLLLVVVVASLSSFYPARRAAALPVREALAHV